MQRSRRPRRPAPTVATVIRALVALVALVALAALTGCAAGFDATARQPYAPSDGVQAESGDIRVLNALVVAGPTGTTGVISTTIANRGDRADRLAGLTSADGTVLLDGTRALPAGSAVTFGAGTDPQATISGLTSRAGETVSLTFTFARASPLTLNTVVVPATGDYAEFATVATLSP